MLKKTLALKEIVKELDKAIFGSGDDGTIDTSENENYQESIGERVKLKNQEKIKEKKYKEDYAMGYDDLDKIDSLVAGKKYGVISNAMDLGGFKKIVDGYKDGMISKRDIYKKYIYINKHTYLNDNLYSQNNNLIALGYTKLLSLIADNIIKPDEEKILDGIEKTNTDLLNKDYITKDKDNNIIPGTYAGLLNKYIKIYKKDSFMLHINDINKHINNIYDATKAFSRSGTDDEKDKKMLERSVKLYYGLHKIYNLAENKIYNRNVEEGHDDERYDKEGYDREGYDEEGYNRVGYRKTGHDRDGNYNKIFDIRTHMSSGKGLKIIKPNQMLSCLPVLLAQMHAGNNSAKLKNKIRQLLYSLYRSKKTSKTVYNNFIATM